MEWKIGKVRWIVRTRPVTRGRRRLHLQNLVSVVQTTAVMLDFIQKPQCACPDDVAEWIEAIAVETRNVMEPCFGPPKYDALPVSDRSRK